MSETVETNEPDDAGSDMDLEVPVDILEIHEIGEWFTAVAEKEEQ